MITNPYKVLGVPDGASIEECTAAYKKLAKKYHPDLNPNDKEAERKMAEINAAYDQIKSGNTGSQSGFSGYGRNGNQSSTQTDYLASAAQFIKSGQYQQAVNLLNTIEDRNALWYYLSALANMSLGNQRVAMEHIRTAYAKEPDNANYQQAYQQITNGINPLNSNPFSSFYDFSDFDYRQEPQTTSKTYNVNGGCLRRIIRVVFIIIAIRFVMRFFFALIGNTNNYNRYPQDTTSGYSQEYNQPEASDYFGESNSPAESS